MIDDSFMEGLKMGKGCALGASNKEKIGAFNDTFTDFKHEIGKKIDKLNDRLFVGIITVIILAFFSGINSWNSVLKLFVR